MNLLVMTEYEAVCLCLFIQRQSICEGIVFVFRLKAEVGVGCLGIFLIHQCVYLGNYNGMILSEVHLSPEYRTDI